MEIPLGARTLGKTSFLCALFKVANRERFKEVTMQVVSNQPHAKTKKKKKSPVAAPKKP